VSVLRISNPDRSVPTVPGNAFGAAKLREEIALVRHMISRVRDVAAGRAAYSGSPPDLRLLERRERELTERLTLAEFTR
jgi:hypothetical protein